MCLVYHITCYDCDATYVGETESALKTQFLEHRRKSSVGSMVSQPVHVDRLEHGMSLDKVKILIVDNRKFERGVKEAIYIRVVKPSLGSTMSSWSQFNLRKATVMVKNLSILALSISNYVEQSKYKLC